MSAPDRKAEARRYKEAARPMGVFRVRHVADGVSLIGTSVDVPAMLNRQRFQLQMGSHPNIELQRGFAEVGEDAFRFEALDVLEPSDEPDADPKADLGELEAMWRERLAATGERFYNPRPGKLT